jgi:CysZ protein
LLFVWEMSLTLGLFVLSALSALFAGPFAMVLAPVLAVAGFLIGCWFYGASVLDFVWERRGIGARAGLRRTAQSHGLALGLGIPFAVWMVIPGVGWFLAPIIAPVTAAAAATIAVHRLKSS